MTRYSNHAGFRWGVSLAALTFLVVAAALVVRRPWVRDAVPPDWRFGIIETYHAPDAATAAGAAWTRVRFHWGDAKPNEASEWLPPVSEAELAAEKAAGREIVGLLIGIPDWARGADLLPAGLWLSPDDPDNLWAAYVREVVGRYRGQIDHWIIWNEPDIWQKGTPGHTWDGEVEDFLQLQRTAYLVARETNPDAVIHLAAFTYFWDAQYGREQYFARLLDAMAADPEAARNNYYFDVATAHLYFQPDVIHDVLQAFRAIMEEHDLEKPLWLVETNAPPSSDEAWPVEQPTFQVGLEEQAAFMPQVLATALAAGAERIAIYKMQDLESDRGANPEPFGLLRLDGSRRPAFDTYEVAVQYLSGVYTAVRERWDAVGQIELDQGNYSTTVLFSRLPQPQQATVPATDTRAVLVDMWGKQRSIQPIEGVYDVELPAAPCRQTAGDYCMIGGPVYYLVQAKPGGTLPDRLPAVRQSPHSPNAHKAAPRACTLPQVGPTVVPPPVDSEALPAPPAGVVTSNTAKVEYPERVTFQLNLEPEHDIVSAMLTYWLDKKACVEVDTDVPVPVTPTGAEWTWVMIRSGNPPPGAELNWRWMLEDTAGNRYWTAPEQLIFVDDRFTWNSVSEDGIRLHWYDGQQVGPILLDAAVSGVEQLENEMGIALDGEVEFYIYGDPNDMREAVLYIQDWAGGVAFTEFNTILMGVPPEIVSSWGRPTIRHELAHLILDQFAMSCLGGHRPTWLEEGLAVYAEGPPDQEQLDDIARGIEENAFLPLRSLGGAFPAHDAGASMAYSQSYSVVNFLLETYGAEPLRALLQTIAGGETADVALENVYGFNTDGLEVAWRASIGAPARAILPTPTAVSAAAIPTVVPLSSEAAVPTRLAEQSDQGILPGICGPLPALLIPLIVLPLHVRRRRSHA